MDKLIDLINQGGTGEYDARQPKERGEAVAWGVIEGDGIGFASDKHGVACDYAKGCADYPQLEVIPLYAHPPADDARVAELVAVLEAEIYAKAFSEINDIADALPGPVYMDPPDGGCTTIAEQVRRMAADVEATRQQLTASREREGRMREALGKAKSLASVALWIAYVWNDRNFNPAHECAKAEARLHGLDCLEDAQDFLTEVAALAAEKGEK